MTWQIHLARFPHLMFWNGVPTPPSLTLTHASPSAPLSNQPPVCGRLRKSLAHSVRGPWAGEQARQRLRSLIERLPRILLPPRAHTHAHTHTHTHTHPPSLPPSRRQDNGFSSTGTHKAPVTSPRRSWRRFTVDIWNFCPLFPGFDWGVTHIGLCV